MIGQIKKELKIVEKDVSKKFWRSKKSAFLSVRSGARVSMPGMMDTILNLGLNDKTVVALAKKPPMEDLQKIAIEDSFKCMVML